jgi:hypothetical protein
MTSCGAAFFAYHRLKGVQQPMVSDFPTGNIALHAQPTKHDLSLSKRDKFAVVFEQDDDVAQTLAYRLAEACKAKGFKLVSEEKADYILNCSYRSASKASIHVKMLKNAVEKKCVWEATAEEVSLYSYKALNYKENPGLLAAYHCSTLYGEYRFYKADYLIASIADHLGEKVSESSLKINPQDFTVLSKKLQTK